jgi:hypothetical protein
MSIGAIANIVSTPAAATAASRPEPIADRASPAQGPPSVDGQTAVSTPPDAAFTTLSDAALAQQAADAQAARDADQAARDAAAAASTSAITSAVYRDWAAAGAPAVDGGVVQEALSALDEASRENLRAAAAALATLQEHAAQQQEAVDEAGTLAVQQRDAAVVFAMNAEIRLAYGALPSPGTGDPVLREPGQVDLIA